LASIAGFIESKPSFAAGQDATLTTPPQPPTIDQPIAANDGRWPATVDEIPAAVSVAEQGEPTVADPGMPGQIGRFVIQERLGQGAFGVVYRAYDPQLDREVAVKVARGEGLNTPQRIERFLREAKSAAQLRHPHIVPLFETGRDDGGYFIVSAFIAGRTLADALAQAGGKLEPRQAARAVRFLAEALAYAHEQGIVHRDVKPANIMLDGREQPLLMDFGLAVRPEEDDG
jgi:serine/threonine protein kinase